LIFSIGQFSFMKKYIPNTILHFASGKVNIKYKYCQKIFFMLDLFAVG